MEEIIQKILFGKKIFTINYLKFKDKFKTEDLNIIENKLKKKNNLIDKSYFSLLPRYGISELYRKIGNYSNERKNRQKIAYQYYNSLKDITVGASFDIENLIGSSDNFSYMIMCKDREHKRNLKKKASSLNKKRLWQKGNRLLEKIVLTN